MRVSLPAMTAMVVLAGTSLAIAQGQAIGPGGVPMAPGPSQPHDYTPGGPGPAGVPVAPGRAARGANVERIGPGGVVLAPGRAGEVGAAPSSSTPTVAPSSGIAGTVHARGYHPKHKRRPRVSRY